MPSIAEMASKGSAKLTRKATTMVTSYNAAKTRMKAGYAGAGFGPARTAAYNSGIDAAAFRAPDPAKWASNWSAKMAE